MVSVTTRRGTATVEADAVTVAVSPVGHAKRLAKSRHGLVWFLVFLGLASATGKSSVEVVGAAVLTGAAFALFLASIWFLRYEARLWPGTQTIAKRDVDSVARDGSRFTVEHGDGRTVVMPLPGEADRFADSLRDHGYPV